MFVFVACRGGLVRALGTTVARTNSTFIQQQVTRRLSFTTAWRTPARKDPRTMTAQEWQELLTPEQFHVAREGATEPPFSGAYYNHYAAGMYQCVCCGTNLFSSKTKYESGSGWPSFHSAEGEGVDGPATSAVATRTDASHGMLRTEVLCRECEAHLGHVFPDGPDPTGLRYCINSAALKFVPKKIK